MIPAENSKLISFCAAVLAAFPDSNHVDGIYRIMVENGGSEEFQAEMRAVRDLAVLHPRAFSRLRFVVEDQYDRKTYLARMNERERERSKP